MDGMWHRRTDETRRHLLKIAGAVAGAAGLTGLRWGSEDTEPVRASGSLAPWADGQAVQQAAGPAWDPTVPSSPWGQGDEAGSSNSQTAEKVLQATRLIKKGRKYLLGHPYEAGMPLFPGNSWQLEMKPPTTIGRQTGNLEFFHGEIGQNGTQFDALGHFGLQPEGDPLPTSTVYYNRFKGDEVYHPTGLRRLGVEKIKPFFTRGILLDIKRYANGGQTLRGGPDVPVAQEVTLRMVRETLAAQGMNDNDITPGDVVVFVTGWEEHWARGTSAYYAGAPGLPGSTPGIGLEVAIWLASKRVACVGADNWGVEVVPYPNDPSRPQAPAGIGFPVHHELIVKNGIPHQESMHLADLAADLAAERNYAFAYIYVPVPIKGASGSPGIPMAVR